MSSEEKFKRKEWQFQLRTEIKHIDREIKRLETEKAATEKQLTVLARKRNHEAIQVLARSMVQSMATALRLQKARASLHAVDLQLTVAGTSIREGDSAWLLELLRELNGIARVPEVGARLESLRHEVAGSAGAALDPDLPDPEAHDNRLEEREALTDMQRRLEELSLDQLVPLALMSQPSSPLPPPQPAVQVAQAPALSKPQPAGAAGTSATGPSGGGPSLEPQKALAAQKRRVLLASVVCLALLSGALGVLHCGLMGVQLPPAAVPPEKALVGSGNLAPRAAVHKHGHLPGPGHGHALTPAAPEELSREGSYDLRVVSGGRLLGCASPASRFPDQPKYRCSGNFSTPERCAAARHPIKDTQYVAAVHAGCETKEGRGTYGYAFDDMVGLKRCVPSAKYEWVLCPWGTEGAISWDAEPGPDDSTRRFRVTNRCVQPVWVQQVGTRVPHEPRIRIIAPNASHTYAIPNRGLPSATFLPKTGCDKSGDNCDVQSTPPCPPHGCTPGIDTRFGASWGCTYAAEGKEHVADCARTAQGRTSTYEDWWDGSAVNGWTLPFSILVDADSHTQSPRTCGNVVCTALDAAKLCPRDEFLTPAA